MFEYYVLNNRDGEVKPFNIFQNWKLDEAVEREVKKYLRAPSKYKSSRFENGERLDTYGFNGFCQEINGLIMWQEWSRVEYEISVGAPFETDCNKLKKIDCYYQCEKNIPMIAREIIWQYKQYIKKEK